MKIINEIIESCRHGSFAQCTPWREHFGGFERPCDFQSLQLLAEAVSADEKGPRAMWYKC